MTKSERLQAPGQSPIALMHAFRTALGQVCCQQIRTQKQGFSLRAKPKHQESNAHVLKKTKKEKKQKKPMTLRLFQRLVCLKFSWGPVAYSQDLAHFFSLFLGFN